MRFGVPNPVARIFARTRVRAALAARRDKTVRDLLFGQYESSLISGYFFTRKTAFWPSQSARSKRPVPFTPCFEGLNVIETMSPC